MKRIIIVFFFYLLILSVKAGQKPNVIIILSDDQGYGDFSCHGNPVLQTPALDRLYNQSIRLDNFHVAPLSTPTRGQLMTGLDAMHNKASTVLSGCCMMRRDIVTMPEVFARNGYKTGIFGKWHLGDTYPDRPMDRGFQKCVWFKGWGLLSEAEFDNDYYRTRYLDSLITRQSEKYCTDLWFEKAMDWMDSMSGKGQPFFTYISLNAAHAPCYALKEDFLTYSGKVNEKTASFFGMIRGIDRNVDRLDKWLEEKGLKENTVVVFMNDNGGTGGIQVYNADMRGEKGSVYDGGHRAACFIRWPKGGLGIPRTVHNASEIQDLLPTFMDMFHFRRTSADEFDGVSLMPAILSPEKKAKERLFVVQQDIHFNPVKYNSCVVFDSWRLVGKEELYDLSKDPGQKNNVAGQYPEILHKMSAFYENWWIGVYKGKGQYMPIVVGSDKENPVILTSADWIEAGPNTQWKVAMAKDSIQGHWILDVKTGGKYRVELSRWPFHLNRALTNAGPLVAVGGTSLAKGRMLSVSSGCVTLNNQAPVEIQSTANATKISTEMDLPEGRNTLNAIFKDKQGKFLCGAYFVRLERISK